MTNPNNQNPNPSTPIFDLNNFIIGENYAIEASAGTGKTYTIKEIVKKLVLNGVPLDKILVVTYTEKAAGELRDRIRQALTEPQKDLNDKSVKELVPPDQWKEIEEATIGTIHSLCQGTIQQLDITMNQPFGLELASGIEITDFAKSYIRQGAPLADINSFLSYNLKISEDRIINRLIDAYGKYYLDLNYQEVQSVIQYEPINDKTLQELLPFVLFDSSDIKSTLQQSDIDAYNAYVLLEQSNNPQVKNLLNVFAEKVSNRDLTPISLSSGPNGITQKNKCSQSEIDAYNCLKQMYDKAKDFDIDRYFVDTYLKDFYKAFQEYKQSNRLQTFNDMLRDVREGVMNNPNLLNELRNKYTYGIIDEFQDTNQLQFDIFEKVFMCEGHNLIVVGDPKQSIYSFQGADVKVYKKAVEQIVKNGGHKFRLATNFRSYNGVVSFGNKMFDKYGFDPQFEPSFYCEINKNKKERRLKYQGKYCAGLWFNKEPLNNYDYANFVVEQILDCLKMDDNEQTYLRKEYLEINEKGELKVREENVTFSDFVILGRAKAELSAIQNLLRKAGIPNVKYKDASLFTSKECAHWIALLEAVNRVDFTGYNRGYFRKALFTKFFNLSLNELSKTDYEKDDIPQIALFEKWRRIASDERWEDLFDAVINDTKLNETLSSRNEAQSLAMFKQIADYAIDYLSNGYKIKDLIDHLKFIGLPENDDDAGDNSAIVARSTASNCVRLMTIHASKGLQFPVVISAAGWNGPSTSDNSYSYYRKNDDGTSTHVLSLMKSDEVTSEEKEEYLRLLYVDYTRPEFLMIMPNFISRGEKAGRPYVNEIVNTFLTQCASDTFDVDGQSVPLYELKDLQKTPLEDLQTMTEEVLQREKDNLEGPDKLQEQKKKLKKLKNSLPDKQSYRHAYSSLSHPKGQEEKKEIIDGEVVIEREAFIDADLSDYDKSSFALPGKYTADEPVSEPQGYPKGNKMGSAIHEVFERIDFISHAHNVEQIIIDRYRYYGINIATNPDWLTYTKNMVEKVLNADLPIVKGGKQLDGYFKLNELSSVDRKAEIEFDFNYPNEELKNYFIGFIDLLFKREQDDNVLYSILDWKSDTLSTKFEHYNTIDDLKGQVDRRYSIQRTLYSYCLIKWLKTYYPDKNEDEIFNEHFGGVYYVFVRGCQEDTTNGVCVLTWPNWESLEQEYLRIVREKGRN